MTVRIAPRLSEELRFPPFCGGMLYKEELCLDL